ncbi:L,D-transpeptidase family protein [Clostridium amazonitimonense]|uniref:L,D-transpeptidase family protein n=1 Tax=Clostridium amazonitimonense TaxID=1499689 RepID=UPI0005097C33|nr:L,D-transpeptidase family protein [Clostridium amazonitimonense]
MFKKPLPFFYKIIFVLTIILFFEIILIYKSYSKYENIKTKDLGIQNINKKKPMVIIVDITTNTLSVFQEGNLIKTYRCAGGKQATPSPIGTWKVINKDTWGAGFGGRWMGLNVPWGKYGIHGTLYPNSIGWNSSQGCIRMKNEDVAELYEYVPLGTNVIIWGGPFGAFGEYLRSIKPGMTGSDVYALQQILKEKGYFKGYINGIYGEDLRYAIHKYQKDNKMPISDEINMNFYNRLGIYLID